MFAWIAENYVTIITIAVLLVIVGVALYSVLNKKKRKGSCESQLGSND